MPERPSSNKALLTLSLLGVSLLGGDDKPKYELDEPERMMAALEIREQVKEAVDRF